MNACDNLSHTKWEGRYHVVFIPKHRRKALFGPVRQHPGPVFRELARQKECEVVAGQLMPDQLHLLLSIPPKYAVSAVLGFIKGKSAIHIARVYAGQRRNVVGRHFWASGWLVSTVGRDEAAVRKHIQEQEKEDQRPDQLDLFRGPEPV